MISSCHTNPVDIKTDLNLEDWGFYNEISSKLIYNEHGVLGGLMLAYLLAIRERFATGDKCGFLINHRPACHAICVHHLKSIPIDLSKHPFAFILSFCDVLQDWGRPSHRENRDLLYLTGIELFLENHLNIRIAVEASEPRKERLVTHLSNLYTGERTKITIVDTNGSPIFQLNSLNRRS